MREKHIEEKESKEIFYKQLEEFARGKIQEHLQDLLEQEVAEWLGREKSERKVAVWNSQDIATGTASGGDLR